jgi:hypothetical protein
VIVKGNSKETAMKHKDNCAYHQDQNEWECNCADTSDIPEASEEWFQKAKLVYDGTPVETLIKELLYDGTPAGRVAAKEIARLRAERLEAVRVVDGIIKRLHAEKAEMLAMLKECRNMVGHPDNLARIDVIIARAERKP